MDKAAVLYNIHNEILLSHKKEQNLLICNNMDGVGGHYAKWNKSEKNKYYMIITYIWNKKYNKLGNITKKNRLRDNKLVVISEEREGEG